MEKLSQYRCNPSTSE